MRWGYKTLALSKERVGLGLGILLVLLMYRFVKKDSLIYVVNQSLPGMEAGLLNGMLWGDKTGFSKDFYNQLKNSGLVHLVVVSGSNIILVFKGLVEKLAKLIGRKKAIGLGFVVVLGYLDIVGWEVPVVRAMILVSVMYWAQILGRKYNLVRGLILSVLIIVLAWPGSLGEVSFWLSFMAFIGVVTSPGKGVLALSFWVSLWISPIMGLFFGKINLVGPISNLLVILVVETITIVGFGGTFLGLIVPVLGKMVLWSIWPLLKYFAIVVEMVGNWGWVNVEVKFNYLILLGWYMILIYLRMKFNSATIFYRAGNHRNIHSEAAPSKKHCLH
ncbi:MAG: ComEC/Rec2 family competence protein [Candidatus Shapirobacteria bacterium]|nr:ComEC/Rec2 family competence protein [Candidatus Shapirobacteria bacterium]